MGHGWCGERRFGSKNARDNERVSVRTFAR
jgi:hypothetical protein